MVNALESTFSPEWCPFFKYIKNTWMNRFPPSLWNLDFIVKAMDEPIICRTNNYLERYNRKMNENLKPHGNIVSLVDFIRNEHKYYRSIINATRDGDMARIEREPISTDDTILSELLETMTYTKNFFNRFFVS